MSSGSCLPVYRFYIYCLRLIQTNYMQINDDTVTALAPGFRFLTGFYQATSTRTAGLSVVNIADLHQAVQVSYMVMMYISVFPIAISVRASNVYEEQSLGIYSAHATAHSESNENGPKGINYVGNHLRRQLGFDVWYVFLGLFLIAIIEGDRLEDTSEYVSLKP